MTKDELEKAKLGIAAIAAIVGAIGLIVTFLSYYAAVERDRVDRTFQLMDTGDGTLDVARSEYQSLLRIISAHPTVLKSDEEHSKLFGSFLSSYRGLDKSQDRGAAAWGFVLPLGDYFERLLLCTQNLACSATIYCAMVEPELVSFARVTEEFRKSVPDQEKPFAASLDQARKRVRCD